MKKVFLSILTILYMTVSSGIAMEIHYCMGKKAGVDFYSTVENKKCGRCGMKDKKSGCCNDEHHFYKLADAHKNITNENNFVAPFIAIENEFFVYNMAPVAVNTLSLPLNNSPPISDGQFIYIRNCNFRL